MDVTLTIGNVTIKHRVLVADIKEDVILGIDIMRRHGYKLDLKNGVLRTDGVKFVTPSRRRLGQYNRSARNYLPKDIGGGISIAKAVIRAKRIMPVRVMNLN